MPRIPLLTRTSPRGAKKAMKRRRVYVLRCRPGESFMRFPVSALPLKKIRAFILLDVRPSSKAPRGRKGSLFAMLFLRNKGPAKRIGTLKGCNDFPGCGLSLSDTRSHTLYLLFARIV